MNQEQVEFIVVQLEFYFEMGGKGAGLGAFCVPDDLVGIGNRDGAVCFFVVGFVGAAAVVTGAAYTEITPRIGAAI